MMLICSRTQEKLGHSFIVEYGCLVQVFSFFSKLKQLWICIMAVFADLEMEAK